MATRRERVGRCGAGLLLAVALAGPAVGADPPATQPAGRLEDALVAAVRTGDVGPLGPFCLQPNELTGYEDKTPIQKLPDVAAKRAAQIRLRLAEDLQRARRLSMDYGVPPESATHVGTRDLELAFRTGDRTVYFVFYGGDTAEGRLALNGACEATRLPVAARAAFNQWWHGHSEHSDVDIVSALVEAQVPWTRFWSQEDASRAYMQAARGYRDLPDSLQVRPWDPDLPSVFESWGGVELLVPQTSGDGWPRSIEARYAGDGEWWTLRPAVNRPDTFEGSVLAPCPLVLLDDERKNEIVPPSDRMGVVLSSTWRERPTTQPSTLEAVVNGRRRLFTLGADGTYRSPSVDVLYVQPPNKRTPPLVMLFLEGLLAAAGDDGRVERAYQRVFPASAPASQPWEIDRLPTLWYFEALVKFRTVVEPPNPPAGSQPAPQPGGSIGDPH